MSEARGTLSPPDAVLARLAPNTPPRGKRKGKGKGPQATERGASSATPTAPNDVDGEGRPVSGEHNIASDLEEAQLQEAIRMSLVDQGGSGVDSSSAGFTHGSSYDLGTNSECSDSDNVFELSDSDEGWTPSREMSKRRVKHSHKKRGTATAAAPSKRQRVHGGSSGKQPKTSGGAKPAKTRSSSSGGSGGNGGGTPGMQSMADLDCYNINRPGGHVGLKASGLLDRFVDSSQAMDALVSVFKSRRAQQPPSKGNTQESSGALFSTAVADLDALAVEHLEATTGDIKGGVALTSASTAWPADGALVCVMFGLCNKGKHSISQLAKAASENHTAAAMLALFDVWRSGRTGDAAACSPFAFNFNPFCCMQTFQAAFGGGTLTSKPRCDVERLGLGAALLRLLCLAALAECNVSVAAALSVTSKSLPHDVFALGELRARLGPAALEAFNGALKLADVASGIVSSSCHPSVMQITTSRHRPWVAVNVTEACSSVLGLEPAGTPTPKLQDAVGMFCRRLKHHSGCNFSLSVPATPTALPAPDPTAEAAAVQSARVKIEERAGAPGLLAWPTKEQSDLAAQAGRSTYDSLVARAKAYLPPGAIASGCAVGATGGGQVVAGTWPNDNTRDGGLLEGNTVWALNTIWAALARGEGAAGFDSAAAVISKTLDAGSFAMCLNRLGINDRAGEEITGSRSPSEDGTTIGKMTPELRADLGLGEGEDAPLLRAVSHGIGRGAVKAMVAAGGSKVVWVFGRHGAGDGQHAVWLGADSYTDVSDLVADYAALSLGGSYGIGSTGGVSVGVASWDRVGSAVVVTNMSHASYPLAVVNKGDARGASGLSASLHFAGANTAVILTIASLLGTPLPRSLEESCAGWLLLGDRGVVGGAHTIMGTIGGAAKYTAEERGAEKSTVELKAEGATAPLKPTTAAQSAYQRMVSAGKTPTRQGVNFTGPEKKRTKSTNELKGDGGKGTQGHNITSSGGSRGARTGREPINDSSVMVSIGLFRRAYKITVGENKGEVKISKRRSKFYRFRDVRGTDSNKWIVGKRRFDSNGSDKTLSYPADDEGNMVTGKEWDADPEKGLYHDHLVTYARDYLQKRG